MSDDTNKLEDSFADALGVNKDQLKGLFDGAMKAKPDQKKLRLDDQPFDEHEYYNKEIWPRMQELARLCNERGLPHLFWAINSWSAGPEGGSGNGLIASTTHICSKKMALLANIADGTLSLDQLVKMALISRLLVDDHE